MSFHSYTETITTDGDGAATVYFGSVVTGVVLAVKYMPGASGIDTGATITLTGEDTAVPILVKASAGTSTVWFYPHVLASKNTDGSAATDNFTPIHVFGERIKLVVASGGDKTTGSMTIFTEEGDRYLES